MRSFQPFLLERTLTGALRLFEYEIDSESLLRVAPVGHLSGPLKAEVLPIPRTLELHTMSGVIDRQASSLFAAMKAAGEGDDLAIKLAGVFSGEIDFNSEVQLGDRFRVVVELFRREAGGATTYGVIHSAEYAPSDGRVLRAIRFAPPGTRPDTNPYYDENGRSLRRFFLKSPLKFEPRVTSRFSTRRLHPVLHTARAHRGVDYGAPTGAPVISVASGTVVSLTSDSTNGRMVRIRHASGYETYYLHLSRFAAGMHAGKRVVQEEVIGYVGSTGLATGPHLHYGLTKNGVFVNPIAEHQRMPPGEPVPPSAMPAFQEVRNRELALLAGVRTADTGQSQARATR
jgi:murein DD-endopeptidase MepM/ murein hydrolase activator NlpD